MQFLVDVGLDYVTLSRSTPTLSGGESQRIRLASQIGSGLTGVLYVLDEPTIGLHPRDNRRLLQSAARTCATWATRWSSSSTTAMSLPPPIACSTSAPAPATAAARSRHQGTPAQSLAKSKAFI